MVGLGSAYEGLKFYDREGEPVSMEEWAKLIEDDAVRVVALTRVRDWHVSTEWSGLQSPTLAIFHPNAPPLMFEQFALTPSGRTWQYNRYPTLTQAEDGHARMVEAVRSHLGASESEIAHRNSEAARTQP